MNRIGSDPRTESKGADHSIAATGLHNGGTSLAVDVPDHQTTGTIDSLE